MQAEMKHHHHQTGVFSSAIPQIFSVIHEKLRPWPTRTARGFAVGFTSPRMAGASADGSATWDMGSGLLSGMVLVPILHAAERHLGVVRHLRVRIADPGQVRRPGPRVQVREEPVVLVPGL